MTMNYKRNSTKVHPKYNESRWTGWNHYVLLFHDGLLEVIARDYKIDIFKTTFEELGMEVAKRMNKKHIC